MPTYDFDFQRYVERRKGVRERTAREGAAYAYSGDLKVLRTLDRLKPVKVAVEGAVKLWRSSARAELLGPALKVTERQLPRVHAAATKCAAALHVDLPQVFVTPGQIAPGVAAWTFGTDDDPAILLHAALVEQATDLELADLVGRELGHLQNNHVLYRTALYFLEHNAGTFVRWTVKPATMALAAWHRRAEVTGDRAGLLCSRDLEASTIALVKLATFGAPVEPGASREQILAAHPDAKKRADALALFAGSAYYTGLSGEATGPNSEACDAEVAKVIA